MILREDKFVKNLNMYDLQWDLINSTGKTKRNLVNQWLFF